jgi:ABC-type antimicrobial peptide transport system ATPase subunit
MAAPTACQFCFKGENVTYKKTNRRSQIRYMIFSVQTSLTPQEVLKRVYRLLDVVHLVNMLNVTLERTRPKIRRVNTYQQGGPFHPEIGSSWQRLVLTLLEHGK